MVVHDCNPGNWGGWKQKDQSSRYIGTLSLPGSHETDYCEGVRVVREGKLWSLKGLLILKSLHVTVHVYPSVTVFISKAGFVTKHRSLSSVNHVWCSLLFSSAVKLYQLEVLK